MVEVCGRFIDDVKLQRTRAWEGKERRKNKKTEKIKPKEKY